APMRRSGVFSPPLVSKSDPPGPGERCLPESIVRPVVHMVERVALPGGGGVKAAIKGYRIAIKTGTAKKVGPDGRYINKYIAYTAGVAPASQPRFALVVVINDPQAGKYYGGALFPPGFGAPKGGAFRPRKTAPDPLTTGRQKKLVFYKGGGAGGEE
ncbi:peptidoglycan glycosyltransferase FtsI, partial [Escherichia coli]|nr:peptidoglycan glycosyltransferase FtsI [Escherichia coli]